MKLARRYGKTQRDGAYEIITAFNSFHGRTQATVAATGQPHYQENFAPLLPGFVHVDYNDVEAVISATSLASLVAGSTQTSLSLANLTP